MNAQSLDSTRRACRTSWSRSGRRPSASPPPARSRASTSSRRRCTQTPSSARSRTAGPDQTEKSLPAPHDPSARSTSPSTTASGPCSAVRNDAVRTPAAGSARSTASRNAGPSCHQWPNSSVSQATTTRPGAAPLGPQRQQPVAHRRDERLRVAPHLLRREIRLVPVLLGDLEPGDGVRPQPGPGSTAWKSRYAGWVGYPEREDQTRSVTDRSRAAATTGVPAIRQPAPSARPDASSVAWSCTACRTPSPASTRSRPARWPHSGDQTPTGVRPVRHRASSRPACRASPATASSRSGRKGWVAGPPRSSTTPRSARSRSTGLPPARHGPDSAVLRRGGRAELGRRVRAQPRLRTQRGLLRAQRPVRRPLPHRAEPGGGVQLRGQHRRHPERQQVAVALVGQPSEHVEDGQVAPRPRLVQPLLADRPAAVAEQPRQVRVQHHGQRPDRWRRACGRSRTTGRARTRLWHRPSRVPGVTSHSGGAGRYPRVTWLCVRSPAPRPAPPGWQGGRREPHRPCAPARQQGGPVPP